MNKNKTLIIIENLMNQIKERTNDSEYAPSKLYVGSWVIGTLDEIKQKIELGNDAPYMVRTNTYRRLFQEFINFYFCMNINPTIKMVTCACLFTNSIRDLIIDLYKALFDKQQRKMDSDLSGYIGFDDKWISSNTRFEIIRTTFVRGGAC